MAGSLINSRQYRACPLDVVVAADAGDPVRMVAKYTRRGRSVKLYSEASGFF